MKRTFDGTMPLPPEGVRRATTKPTFAKPDIEMEGFELLSMPHEVMTLRRAGVVSTPQREPLGGQKLMLPAQSPSVGAAEGTADTVLRAGSGAPFSFAAFLEAAGVHVTRYRWHAVAAVDTTIECTVEAWFGRAWEVAATLAWTAASAEDGDHALRGAGDELAYEVRQDVLRCARWNGELELVKSAISVWKLDGKQAAAEMLRTIEFERARDEQTRFREKTELKILSEHWKRAGRLTPRRGAGDDQ